MQLREDDWIQQSRSHARALATEIERLKTGHGDGLGLRDFDYPAFWAHAREIVELFKTLKPIARADRERLWASYSWVCEETKKAQQRDHGSREPKSREKRTLVMSKITEASHQAKGATSAGQFARADAMLAEALDRMKNGWDGFNVVTQFVQSALSRGRMSQEDHTFVVPLSVSR